MKRILDSEREFETRREAETWAEKCQRALSTLQFVKLYFDEDRGAFVVEVYHYDGDPKKIGGL